MVSSRRMADRDRQQLKRFIQQLALVTRGEKIALSSGLEVDFYVDLRRVTFHGQAAPLVGQVMLELTADWRYDAAGGPTLGADPIAGAMLHAAAASGRVLHAFAVRKEAKAYGLQHSVEGPNVAGRYVLAVEDTATTGDSLLRAIGALREAGAHVVGAAVLVDRHTGAREKIEAAGLSYRAAYDIREFDLTRLSRP